MTLEELWRRKSDEDLLAASRQLGEYTQDGQHVILEELRRRRESGVMVEAAMENEGADVVGVNDTSDGVAEVPHGFVRRLWLGEVSLPITYWVWGVAVNFALLVAMIVATPADGLVLALAFLTLHFLYYVFIVVAIWRSSGRYKGRRVWADLARVSLALGLLRTIGILLAG